MEVLKVNEWKDNSTAPQFIDKTPFLTHDLKLGSNFHAEWVKKNIVMASGEGFITHVERIKDGETFMHLTPVVFGSQRGRIVEFLKNFIHVKISTLDNFCIFVEINAIERYKKC